jgi:hypothetical protein
LSLTNMLGICKMYISHIQNDTDNYFTKYTRPITVAALARTLRSSVRIPLKGTDVCVRLFCVFVVLWVGSRLARPKNPTVGVKKHYETEEEARAQQRSVMPLKNE